MLKIKVSLRGQRINLIEKSVIASDRRECGNLIE